MNAVEIEEAISALADQRFDASEFPFAFLQAFGNREVTLKRLRKGESNKSDLGGVLQTNNIHIAIASAGEVTRTLAALKASPATTRAKAKFILATDGETFEAEDLTSGDTVACAYADFPDNFGFFLPLAGITTVQQVRESSFDIRATSRLNRLYVELLKDNPEWGTENRRPDMNHFMARLIFCFFAEDTDIFPKSSGRPLFTATVETMSARDSSNTHEVIGRIFLSLNLRQSDREGAGVPRWADTFPYVNGGLFSGSLDVPKFSKIARSYLLHIGNLDWTKINPDIFGSMIQAVAEEEERGALGMHYTSVPNILKVLNPLFLDDLRAKLEEARDNARTLLNLRKRISRIRVFDPACGSGNFLVIAYKEMRAIEADINKRRGEADRRSEIPLTNFRGIELRDFPAEVARLALIIAEYQCDVLYRGQKLALDEFLPLENENWITCGNALRLDWISACPPTGTGVKVHADDLFSMTLPQSEIDFENEGGETYICGNPPYSGKGKKEEEILSDMNFVFAHRTKKYGYVDYVGAWLLKAADFIRKAPAKVSLVATNSVCQGRQVSQLWPLILSDGVVISFAHTSFKWRNNASNNAVVTCVIVGLAKTEDIRERYIYGDVAKRSARHINAYLLDRPDVYIDSAPDHIGGTLPKMVTGSVPNDGGFLILDEAQLLALKAELSRIDEIVFEYYGAQDFISGKARYCLYITDEKLPMALSSQVIRHRLDQVKALREKSKKREARELLSKIPHKFQHDAGRPQRSVIIVPRVTTENRDYLPVGLLTERAIISDQAFGIFDVPLWSLAILSSRIHLVWIATVCGRLKTDFRYSNSLGWNSFPIGNLTEKNKADLTRSAVDILLAREAHFPATIADLYDPVSMPVNLRDAHERNDEVLERVYIGRRFRNDTERLEKLFELYTKMSKAQPGKLSIETGKQV
jgi:hypothetical protein